MFNSTKKCNNCIHYNKQRYKDCVISFNLTSCPIYYTPPLNGLGDCDYYKRIWWKFWALK